jgi:hypothetical protein
MNVGGSAVVHKPLSARDRSGSGGRRGDRGACPSPGGRARRPGHGNFYCPYERTGGTGAEPHLLPAAGAARTTGAVPAASDPTLSATSAARASYRA